MSSLTSRTVADSYPELLKLESAFTASSDLRQMEDGVGNVLPIQISQDKVKITGELLLSDALSLAYPLVSTWTGESTALSITSLKTSSSPTTGALTVAGGVGVQGNAYIGQDLNVIGQSFFTGNSQFSGNVNIDGVLTLKGNINVGDGNTDSISFNADVTSDILPDTTETYDLGSQTKSWDQVYAKEVIARNITAQGSGNVVLSPIGTGAGTVTISPASTVNISPTGILTINPTATSNLNNVTIGGTTPRDGTFTNITQSGTAGAFVVSGTTDSTSSTTGAARIAGGLGVAKNLYVGGSFNIPANVTSTNSAAIFVPLNVSGASTFTSTGAYSLTINPPNTTTIPLRIANNNSDSVTVDAAGQLNVLKSSVFTGQARFNSTTTVNEVFQQIDSTKTSSFAGPLNIAGSTNLRSFYARDALNSTNVLSFDNTTNTLSTSNAILSTALNISQNTGATAANFPYYFNVNSVGKLTAVNEAAISAGTSSTSSGQIILAGTCSSVEPTTAGIQYLRIRPQINLAGRDIATVDFGAKTITVGSTINLTPDTNINSTGGSIASNIVPTASNSYDLGSTTRRWKDLYLTNSLTIGGAINATLTGSTPHVFSGNVQINGSLTVSGQTTQPIAANVSSISKRLDLNTAVDDSTNNLAKQNLSSSAIDGGLFIAATLPTQVFNAVAAADAAVETISHSFGVPLLTSGGVTAIRKDTNADVTSLFTYSQTSNTAVTITWNAGTSTSLGTAGAVGGIVFTLTPQSSYGAYVTNSATVANGVSQTITHNLLTTAVSVSVIKVSDGTIIPNTTYSIATPNTTTATLTWNSTAPTATSNAAAGTLRIKVVPTATVQKYSSVTYTTPATSNTTPKLLEPQLLSSDNFGLAAGKSYFINNTRVLNETSLGDAVVSSKLASVGTITSGVWQGTTISGAQGGTGAVNTGRTITIAGNFSTTGTAGSTCALALSGNTAVTLPLSGTLATLANSETLTNKTLGTASGANTTIPAGALSSDLAVVDGGTGRGTLTANGVLFGSGTNAVGMTAAGTDKQVLISSAGVPTFATISPVITLTGDVTGTGTMTDLGSVTINTTVGADQVALGTDTTGAYTQSVAVSGSGLSLTNATPTADGAQVTIASNATSLNTANTLVFRDSSGNFSAGTITGNLSGNASTASSAARWTTSRTLTLSGNITGSVTLDGSGDATMSNTAYSPLSITNAAISATAAIVDTKLATISTAGKVANSATTATSATGVTDTASLTLKNTIVSRDNNGEITVNRVKALNGFDGVATGVLDNVSRQRVKVSGYDASANAVSLEKDEIVFTSNSNCSVWVSPDATGTKSVVQVSVPAVTSFVNDFNDANLIVSDDVSGGRIKFRLDTLSSASSAFSGGTPRQLTVSDSNQTLVGYTNASPLLGTPGTLTSFPFLKWDSVPQALEVKIAASGSTDSPQTVYVPFYTA